VECTPLTTLGDIQAEVSNLFQQNLQLGYRYAQERDVTWFEPQHTLLHYGLRDIFARPHDSNLMARRIDGPIPAPPHPRLVVSPQSLMMTEVGPRALNPQPRIDRANTILRLQALRRTNQPLANNLRSLLVSPPTADSRALMRDILEARRQRQSIYDSMRVLPAGVGAVLGPGRIIYDLVGVEPPRPPPRPPCSHDGCTCMDFTHSADGVLCNQCGHSILEHNIEHDYNSGKKTRQRKRPRQKRSKHGLRLLTPFGATLPLLKKVASKGVKSRDKTSRKKKGG
jgi:hypothetical protein